MGFLQLSLHRQTATKAQSRADMVRLLRATMQCRLPAEKGKTPDLRPSDGLFG
jgi:hypothetical protein